MKQFIYNNPQGESVEVPFEHTDGVLTIGENSWPCDGESVWLEGRRVPFWTHRSGETVQVWLDGHLYSFNSPDPRARRGGAAQQGGSGQVLAQMPGKILTLAVEVGQDVEPGQALLVMESMKMELTLAAPCAGRVGAVEVKAQDMVSQGQLLVEIVEPQE